MVLIRTIFVCDVCKRIIKETLSETTPYTDEMTENIIGWGRVKLKALANDIHTDDCCPDCVEKIKSGHPDFSQWILDGVWD